MLLSSLYWCSVKSWSSLVIIQRNGSSTEPEDPSNRAGKSKSRKYNLNQQGKVLEGVENKIIFKIEWNDDSIRSGNAKKEMNFCTNQSETQTMYI